MHIKRHPLLAALSAAAIALFAGCSAISLTNLTSSTLPENPSEIYTFTLRVDKKLDNVPDGSISAHVVVDGQDFMMKPSSLGQGIYEFEYQLPPGRDELAYYYLVQYGLPPPAEVYTGVLHAKIVHRYVLSLETNRGPIGAGVGVMGRGFTPQDVVNLNNVAARTVFSSPTSLTFFVPPLPTGQNYSVTLGGAAGTSPVGTFRVDPTTVSVSPASLALGTGDRQTLTFTVSSAAPAGGLLLDVTTDAPESVIMPEVIVPQGQTSVTITVEGGKAGTGSLFLKGSGGGDLTIPVTVSTTSTGR